jgi:peptidoglycan/LPS O-acetylase OafA/YrhL
MPYFAFGMLVALWVEQRRSSEREPRPLSGRVSAALVVGGLAIVALDAVWHAVATRPADDWVLSTLSDIPAGIGFALVVVAAVAGGGAGVRWMSVRPLAWVGLVSYGVYLWHVPLLLFARRVGVMPDNFFVTLALALPPVLAVSAASWYFVERPLTERASRARARRGRRTARSRLEAHAAP